MMVLDLDPNVVRPGWTPLLITLALAVIVVLLYRSMRRQFRRIQVLPPDAPNVEPPSSEPLATETEQGPSKPADRPSRASSASHRPGAPS